MSNGENAYCPDKDCKDYGVRNQGNIGKRGKYGKDKKEKSFILQNLWNSLCCYESNSEVIGNRKGHREPGDPASG